MKPVNCLACLGLLVLTLAQAVPAQDSADLAPLIDKVLKAHGGEKKLNDLQAFVEKTKTTRPGGTTTILHRYIQLPDQSRFESEFELQGKRVKCVLVFAGDSGWRKFEGKPTEPYRAAYKGKKDPLKYAGPRAWLRFKDPAYTLTRLEDTKVGDRPAFGIGLRLGKDPVERFFFDKETSLLIKLQSTVLDDTFHEDYQAVDGIPFARKITRKKDGKTTQQIEVVEFRVVEKLDAKLFQKP